MSANSIWIIAPLRWLTILLAATILSGQFAPTTALAQVDLKFAVQQIGSASKPAVEFAAQQPRTWTDISGKYQAEATLVSADAAKVRLRKANGKYSTVNMAQLSDLDQQFVRKLVAAVRPNRFPSFVETWVNRTQLLRWWNSAGKARLGDLRARTDKQREVFQSENLVYVQVSKKFLSRFLERDVRRNTAVRDNILGTDVHGRATTLGKIDLSLVPSEGRAVADLLFTGTTRSSTVGYNGPVQLHGHSTTRFAARKRLVVGPEGPQALPAVSNALTSTETDYIRTSLPRLRGRIAERIAWRRVGESRPQAEYIASAHAKQRINKAFDATVDNSVTRARVALAAQLPRYPYQRDRFAGRLKLSSTKDALQIALIPVDMAKVKTLPKPPATPGDSDITVHLYAPMLNWFVSEAFLRKSIRESMEDMLKSRIQPVAGYRMSLTEADINVQYSPDRAWFTFIWNEQPETTLTHKANMTARSPIAAK